MISVDAATKQMNMEVSDDEIRCDTVCLPLLLSPHLMASAAVPALLRRDSQVLTWWCTNPCRPCCHSCVSLAIG